MYTTIQIKRSTKKLLDNLGKKNETYDDLVQKIVLNYTEVSK